MHGNYARDMARWREGESPELTIRIREIDGTRRLLLVIDDQEIYSCPSADVVFWGMKIAALMRCDDQENILRRLRAVDSLRLPGAVMGSTYGPDEDDD